MLLPHSTHGSYGCFYVMFHFPLSGDSARKHPAEVAHSKFNSLMWTHFLATIAPDANGIVKTQSLALTTDRVHRTCLYTRLAQCTSVLNEGRTRYHMIT